MKQIVTPLIALVLSFGLIAQVGAAELKIGFVNTARVLEESPQAKSPHDRLQKEFAPKEADLLAMQKKLKGKQDQLERNSSVMTTDKQRKLERQILSLQRDIKRTKDEFAEDLNIRKNEELAKLQREAAEAIMSISQSDKYDLVFESGVVFASKRVNITDKVLEKLRGAK